MSRDINIDVRGIAEAVADSFFGGDKQINVNGPKINVSSPVDVKPNGEIDFTPVYDDINKESKDIKKKVEIPVEVELTAQQQQIKDQIISLLNRVASRQDYKKEGQINQDWFNRTVKELERSVKSGNTKNITFTKQDVEKAFLLRGIANKEYKPRNAINVDQKSLDLIGQVLNEDYITNEINKFLASKSSSRRTLSHSPSLKQSINQFDKSAFKDELDSVNQLNDAVNSVTESINAKTEAFKKERDAVTGYISDELNALEKIRRSSSVASPQSASHSAGHSALQENAGINVKSQNQVFSKANSPYVWYGEKQLSSRAIADYILNSIDPNGAPKSKYGFRDLSRFTKEIEQFSDDGSLDISSTTSALIKFRETIGDLANPESVEKLFDTLLQMAAFNEVLQKIGDDSAKSSGLSAFKMPGVNKITPMFDSFKESYAKNYIRQQEEIRKHQTEGVLADKYVASTPAQISNYSSNNKDLDDARFRMIALSVAAENAKENLGHLNSSIEILNDTFDKINSLSNQLQKSTAAFDAINKIDLSSIQNNIQDISSLSGLLNEYSGAVGNALKSTSDLAENLNQLNSSLLNLSKNNSSNTDQLSQKENAATQIQKEISAVDEDISATKSLADVKRRIIQKLSEDEKLTNYAKLGSNVAKYEAKYGVKSPFELDPRHADAELADIKDGLLRFVNGFRKQISQMFDGFIGKHMPGLQNTSNPIYTNINPNSLTTSQLKIDTQKDIESITLLIKKLNEIQEKLKSDIPSAVQVKTSAFQQEQQDVEQVVNSERKYFEDFEKYLSGQFKDSVHNSNINTLLTDESDALPALTQQITNVTKAVELKTNAFKTEHDNVLRWIKDETDGFDSLANQASDVSINLAPKDQSNVNTSQGDFNNGSPSVSQNRRYNSDWNLPALVSALRKVSWQEDESNNLPPDDIKILTKLLSGSIGSLHGYYKGARQIATGKFSLDKLDDYLYKALPLLDVINSLPDIEQYANLTEIDAQTGQSEYVNKALHSVYEAFKEEQQAIVNSTSKLLEQGNLISDISSILYDGSKPLIDRMNELAKYAINNAGAIHSSISRTEEYDDAKSALKYLGRNASKHHIKTALLKEGLLPSDQKAGLPGENNEWNYYYKQIQPLLDNIDSLPDDLRKKLESFRKAEEHIINDVVKDAISAAQQRAADLGANALTNNSPTAKANRAINRLSSQQRENEYQTLKLFQENGMLYGVKNVDKLSDAEVNKLLDDQAARLKDLTDKRKEEYAIIKLAHKEISDENGILKQQWQYYKDIVNVAKEYAQQRLNEAGRNIENNPYKKDANNLYDIFYRAENFNQKKQTVGIVGQEESALQSAISDYEELRKKLEAIAVTSKEASDALKWLDDKQSQASDKLKNKWSDARDRRYGSYLNENDERGSYRTRDDVLLGLQRYASRQGADGFKLFDGKSIGNIQKYRAEINGVDGTIEKLNLTLNKTTHELYSVSMGTKQSTSFFESFGEGLKRRAINLVQYAMTFASIRTAIQGFRAAINTIKDLDSAFVELSRISHDSSSALEEFRKRSFDVADAVGSTASQVINAAAQWEHLGYNVKEASELAEVQMIYKNIADGMSSDSEATEDLVSIMKAYDFQANQAIDVTDALIAVSNNYAVTAADIGNALKRSASAMAVANNTFEQNVALATAMAEVTQNAEKSGSALQVLSLRIRGAKTELQEMGEDTDGMAASTSKLRAQVKGLTKGFDIMKDETTFKQTYDIMKGIAAVWDDLDDIQRASLLETLAGKVRANQVAALLDNFSQAEKVLQTIAEDEGTAIANNEAKLNTIEARITKFRNATQHLTADIFQPEMIKDVIDGGTTIVNILDKFIQKAGTLSLAGGIFGGLSTVKGGGIVGGLLDYYQNINTDPYAGLELSKGQINQFTAVKAGWGEDAAIKSLGELTDKQKEVLVLMGQKNIGMEDAIKELGESAKQSSSLFDVFKAKGVGAIKAVGMAAANFAIAAVISAAVSAAIKLIDEWVNHTKHLNEASKEYGSQIKSISKDIDSFKEQIAKQKSIIDDNKSSIEDVTKARSELYDLQQQMVETYGNEAGAINTITEAINGNTDALGRNIDKLKEIQYQNIVEDFNKEHGGIFYQMTAPLKQQTINSDGTIQLTTMTPFEEAMHDMEHSKVDMSNLVNVSTPELKKYYEDFARNHGWDDSSNIEDHVDILMEFFDGYLNALDNMKQSTDSIMTEGQYNVMKESVSKLRQPIRETSEQNRDIYNQTMLHNMRTGMYKETYDLLNDLYTKYTNAKDEEVQQQVLDAYSKAIDQIKSDGSMEHGMQEAFINLYPVLQSEASKWSFKLKFEADEDHLRTSIASALGALTRQNNGTAYTTEELINWNPQLHTTDQNNAYNNLSNIIGPDFTGGINQAASAGLIDTPQIKALKDQIKQLNDQSLVGVDETLLATIKDVDDLQKKFTYAWGKIGKDVPNGAQKVNTALKLIAREEEKQSNQIKELNGMDLSDVAKHLTKLNDVYDKLKKDGEVKWNTIDTKDFKESFGEINDETGEFQKAFDDFNKVLSSTPNDTKAVQDAFDTLASAYVYNSDCMQLLNENNKDLVIGMLSDNGVLNATEVVNDALARKAAAAEYDAMSEQLLANTGADLANMTDETATATLEQAAQFLQSEEAANLDTAAIAKLILEQWALSGSQIDTSGSCNALLDLAQMAGVATGSITALNAALAGGASAVPAGMSADEWDQVYDKEAYYKQAAKDAQEKTLEELRNSRKKLQLGGVKSSGSGGGGGGGSNKEPSKTDKEFDYVNRAIQIMQEQNDELREKVDNQYIILQDAKDNLAEFTSASDSLNEAEAKLTSLGIDTKSDDFKNFLNTLDEVELVNDEMNQMIDDTPGYVLPADDTFAKVEAENYSDLIEAAKEYKSALGDVEKAKEKVNSKTLDENGTGQLTFIKQLQESDKKLIAAYEHAADSYNTEWEEYKAKILEAFKEDGRGEKYIQDIMYGNLDPEEWERMITYDSNDQTMKDNVELLERGQTAYDHNKESLKSMREWQQKLNDDIQKEYEMRLNIIKAEMVAIESKMNEAQFDLDMKDVLGEVVQEADYQRLINISEEQVGNYRQQLDVLNEQLDSLDEGEQAWYDCKQQIADCENSIRDCVKQQAEWNDTILRMPVENISRFLGLIQNLGQTLKNWLSVNDAKGIAQTAEQIQTSWTTAYDQIADDELGLMKQLEDYEELLENYDLGQDKFSEVDGEIQSARDSVESLVEEMIELNKQLLTLPIDKISEMTEYLDGTLSGLQQVQSDYETTINTVIDLINHQTEKIQDEYDELQKKIEDQIKPLQDQIDALQKANDKRDRQLQIENALYELEKAREQHTVQVIRNGQVRYEADAEAVRNAQQGYDDAQYNKLLGDLQDKIDELNDQLADAEEATNDQVDALNDILKNRWETIMPDTERNRNEEVASQFFMDMFGVSNWKELVLAGKNANGVYADERIYQGTRAGYEQNSVEMRDTQRQIDINNIITESLTRLVEDFQADKINSEQLSAKVSTLMSFVSDGLITGQERLENTLSLGDYSNLGAALKDANRQRDNQMNIFSDNLAIAQENRDQVNELIGRWDDFKVWYDETYQQLYEQYKKIDFIGDTVAKWYDSYEDDDDGSAGYWDGPSSLWEEDGHYHAGDGYYDASSGQYYADGLEKGSVGSMSASDKFKAIQALGLKKLDPDEFPAILHLGEGVINPKQQSTMLGNVRQALALGGNGGAVIQMSFGDITLPSVTNGQDFAESLATQFQPAMNQIFQKIFRR